MSHELYHMRWLHKWAVEGAEITPPPFTPPVPELNFRLLQKIIFENLQKVFFCYLAFADISYFYHFFYFSNDSRPNIL